MREKKKYKGEKPTSLPALAAFPRIQEKGNTL